jgi:hypothetical protein
MGQVEPRRIVFVTALSIAIAVASNGWCGEMYYTAKLPDAYGMQQDVSFSGQLDGGVVTGVAQVGGNDLQVEATVGSDGSLSGVVGGRGQLVGGFAGAVGSDGSLVISYDLGGRSGTVVPNVSGAALVQPSEVGDAAAGQEPVVSQ